MKPRPAIEVVIRVINDGFYFSGDSAKQSDAVTRRHSGDCSHQEVIQ